MTLDTKLNQP